MTLLLAGAAYIASKVVDLIKPYCEQVEIGGSIRRLKLEGIKDIEIVAKPKFEDAGMGLFERVKYNALDVSMGHLIRDGKLEHGLPRGGEKKISAPFSEKYYAVRYEAFPVDIFCCLPPAQWGVVKLLRTGSWQFNKWIVVQGWNQGLHFGGLEKGEQGAIYRIQNTVLNRPAIPGDAREELAERLVETPEEEAVFRVLGLNFVQPVDHSIRQGETEDDAKRRWRTGL